MDAAVLRGELRAPLEDTGSGLAHPREEVCPCPTTRRSAFCAVIVLVTAESLSAQGGPPLMTDDPGTPGDGNWEVNLAGTVEKRRSETTFEAPLLDVNYGVGERIQLKFELPWLFVHEEGEGTKNGLGNSLIGLKWRFLEEEAPACSGASIRI